MVSSTARRRIAAFLLCALVGENEGCDRPDVTRVLEQAGFTDAPPPTPEHVDILCDPTPGSRCDDEVTRRELTAVIAYLWARMGSRLVVWRLGENAIETIPLATVDVPTRALKSRRVEREAQSRFLDSVVQAVCPVIAARALHGRARHSPLVESFSRIASESSRGLHRRIVVLSDAHEVTSLFGNWECRNPPLSSDFTRELDRHRMLRPGTLDGARIHFVHSAPDTSVTHRCPITIEKEERIRDLWRTALRRAGAAEVSFDLGGFELAAADTPRP
jgi:hypothetical protein